MKKQLATKLQYHVDAIREIGQLLRTDDDTIYSPSQQLKQSADIAEGVAEDITRGAVGELVQAAFRKFGGDGDADATVSRLRSKAA